MWSEAVSTFLSLLDEVQRKAFRLISGPFKSPAACLSSTSYFTLFCHYFGFCSSKLASAVNHQITFEKLRNIWQPAGFKFRFLQLRIPCALRLIMVFFTSLSLSHMHTVEFHCFFLEKDLTKISMPVALNEPISFLQRIAEYMEYSELLLKAVKHSDPIRRLEVSLSSIPIKLPAFVVPRVSFSSAAPMQCFQRTVDFNRYTWDGGLKFHRSLQW